MYFASRLRPIGGALTLDICRRLVTVAQNLESVLLARNLYSLIRRRVYGFCVLMTFIDDLWPHRR